MNKQELSRKLAERANITQGQAHEIVDLIFDPEAGIVAKELRARREVALAGFGKFVTRMSKPRQGRNPATGEALDIPAARHVGFKAGTTLKQLVKSTGK